MHTYNIYIYVLLHLSYYYCCPHMSRQTAETLTLYTYVEREREIIYIYIYTYIHKGLT